MRAPVLVLASGSPRRRDLLTEAGFRFEVDAADIDETVAEGEAPEAATARLAREKAGAVASRRRSGGACEVVLAADTTVVLGAQVLGKPRDTKDAARMLLSLAGRNHVVLTGWTVVGADGAMIQGMSRSVVRMREVSRREAEEYAAGGEPMDKAGAYAAQGDGRRFIAAIVGPLDNVIGLPVAPVAEALSRLGVRPS